MNLTFVPKPNVFQSVLRLNGLGCPQCSSPLVDTPIGVRTNGVTKDTHCVMCDFVSTYNTQTMVLAKRY